MMSINDTLLKPFAVVFAALMAGCSATTKFESVGSDVRLKIDDRSEIVMSGEKGRSGSFVSLVDGHTFRTTSFGQYRFKAEGDDGQQPMYGNIPLKFNGGYLALDILFFAPAMFFNLREVYPYYQFDIEKQEVRYRSRGSDNWSIYKPTPEEISEAKAALGE